MSCRESDDLLTISVERTGTTVRIAVSGEVDISTAERLREQTHQQLNANGEIVLLDLSEVSFIDSTGLHAVLDAANRAPDRLRVIPGVAGLKLFTITGVANRLPLVETHDHDGLRPHPGGNLNELEPGAGY